MAERDIETVRKIADLARLDIRGAEAEKLAEQFASILEHFQVLAQLDVAGVDPMLSGSGAAGAEDLRRDDVPRPSLHQDRILANAPDRRGEFYGVPKTVGGEE